MGRLSYRVVNLIAFGLLACANLSIAQPAKGGGVSDALPVMIGEWKAVRIENLMWNEKSWSHDNTRLSITIDWQDGAVFKGEVSYEAPHAPGHDGEQEVAKHTFDVLGVISWNGKEFTLVSHAKDAIVFRGKWVDPDRIEVIGHEAGEHAWVARQVYVRQ